MRATGNLQWDEAYPNAEVFLNDILLQQLWLIDVADKPAAVAAITTEQPPEYAQLGWDISETALTLGATEEQKARYAELVPGFWMMRTGDAGLHRGTKATGIPDPLSLASSD